MVGMETDYGILDDCFQIVLKKMLQDEVFMKWTPAADLPDVKTGGAGKTSARQPMKKGRKPKIQ